MAVALGMLGQESVTANELGSAYRRYENAKFLSQLLLDREPNLPGHKDFRRETRQALRKSRRRCDHSNGVRVVARSGYLFTVSATVKVICSDTTGGS